MTWAITVLLCLIVGVTAAVGEELSQQEKVELLKMGLILNGGDTTKWGPVDLTRRNDPPPPPPTVVQTVPVPVPAAKPVKQASADICQRHGKRKVVRGSSWRCR